MGRPMDLAQKSCGPCHDGTPPLPADEAQRLQQQVPGWTLVAGASRIERRFDCKDFAGAVSLLNRIAEVAEAEGHHPDLHVESFHNLRVELWTHAANGLTENDFILAAKIDQVAAA